jgi:cytochrome c oxidase cbb3-type subunit 3
MSQFSSSFWDIYISVITIVSVIACGIFLKMQSSRKVSGSGSETTGHTWDETLGEYNNPMPQWWMWLFYLTIAFSLAYLYFYPGLGSYPGSLGWTQVKQLEDEVADANKQYGPIFEKYAKMDVKELATDAGAQAMGQKLFLNHCAQCHASDAGGSRGFPNLTDKDWLYGGEPEAIKATLINGRNGVMPPMAAALGEQGTKDVAHYVMSLSGAASDGVRVAKGKDLFAQNCAACHGPEGKGNQQLGAPNLTDKIWLYGSGEANIVESIVKGRNNQMPAHKDLLSEAKIHLLTGYVYALSNGGAAAAKTK